jgi:hypothetical protein
MSAGSRSCGIEQFRRALDVKLLGPCACLFAQDRKPLQDIALHPIGKAERLPRGASAILWAVVDERGCE